MTAAAFTSMGRGKAGPEEQFIEDPGKDTEEDFQLVLEDAEKQPKEGKQGASKSKNKKLAQTTERTEAPPEETPPDPKSTKPHTNPAPTEPQPGTSKAPTKEPTQAPTDEPTKPAATNPDEDEPPASTKYVKAYQAAGKEWLDSVVKDGEAAYTKLFDKLLALGENFAKSTQVLEKKITDKDIFLDIIKQVQLPSIKVEIRTVEEIEKMEGKTYRQLTLMCHLPNFKRNPNAKDQTRMKATSMYCVLHEQITGIRASQTGCATDFKAPTMPFKRLITGKKQPGGLGRSSEAKGRSSRSLEDVAKMEGPTLAKRTRMTTKSTTAKVTPKSRGKKVRSDTS